MRIVLNTKQQLPVIFLMGPTASGKTDLAISLLEHLPIELINVDSAQIYQQMDIGTAKPDAKTLSKAPHRLLGFCDPADTYSAADFVKDAKKEISDIEIEYKNGNITEQAKNKAIAELKDEPWVEVKHMEVNPENAKAGYIELDWNDQFVAMLQANGYTGESDESVVNKWFNDVCKTVLLQEQADLDFGMQPQNDVITVRNEDNDDGTEPSET